MNRLLESLKAFCKDEDGLTTVEYVIAASLLVGVVTLVFATMDDQLITKFDNIMGNTPPP
ncbi:Flp family type IVb pilin [Vibrio salinus]|uniref:Flp family type IVb pilin n=1 Tax=Vibrio salinus TaxID=2899784 RepID=UPI001E3ED060|nr:Flp family type IVb pilin [Vibrio salinus]MCE0492674.1 Flp family type IVb pilin [Vibrio salinus]